MRWRKQERYDEHFGQANNEEAVREELVVAQPNFLDIYYNTCSATDQHSIQRQEKWCIERNIETQRWYKRVTTSLFRLYLVNAWLMYNGDTTYKLHPEPELHQKEFYCALE